MQSSRLLSLSPSFNGYSSSKPAEIAARVVEEFREESEPETDDIVNCTKEEKPRNEAQEQKDDHEQPEVEEEKLNGSQEDYEEDNDFEFAFVTGTSTISADEIFYNGQIRPMFPLFNRDLLGDTEMGNCEHWRPPTPSSIRLPLRKLLIEDRDPSSCSSSEADELDGIPPGTYCVWTPKTASAAAAEKCKKSNSTGSSKRWKFRDLLHRSNSDGKDTFVFLTPSSANSKKKKKKEEEKIAAKGVVGGEGATATVNYTKSTAMKANENRRLSYLPYRQDVVGFFANVNGLSRNLHPF